MNAPAVDAAGELAVVARAYDAVRTAEDFHVSRRAEVSLVRRLAVVRVLVRADVLRAWAAVVRAAYAARRRVRAALPGPMQPTPTLEDAEARTLSALGVVAAFYSASSRADYLAARRSAARLDAFVQLHVVDALLEAETRLGLAPQRGRRRAQVVT